MDLSLITKRIEKGVYTSKDAFVKDFKRMVENCAFYNGLQSGKQPQSTTYVRKLMLEKATTK